MNENISQSFSWMLLSFKGQDDILEDNAQELANILGISSNESRQMIDSVLSHYHFHQSIDSPDLDRDIYSFIVHLTGPYRGPIATTRMDWVINQLNSYDDQLQTVLDYGGGGGKDSIIFSKLGCEVVYSDILSTITPYIKKRFDIRKLKIEIKDVRDLKGTRFDVINCMDVIEHVYDVEYVVADMIARLRRGGHLICYPAFYNSWDGDHIEKNCGYSNYFIEMLQQVGIEYISHEKAVFHLIRQRPEKGSIVEEREVIRRELYQLSKLYAWQFASKGIHNIPLGIMKSLLLNEPLETNLEQQIEPIISLVIDNLAIWRLSTQRLSLLDTKI